MRTAVGLLASVEAHMSLKVMITCKTLVTDFTLKGLFTRVSAFVILKYMLVTKAAIASLAGEHLVLAVVRWGGGRVT